MKELKYKLTNETIEFEGRILHRIIALKDFDDVKKGDLGGWVESEKNLSQCGDCWIYDNAKCMDNSMMHGNSRMFGNSRMYGNSTMHDNSTMHSNSMRHGNSRTYDSSMMFYNSRMHGNSVLKNNEKLYEKLMSKVDNFVDLFNKEGRIVTCVLKN